MNVIETKYSPSIQKALFHKDVVAHIRKWIKETEDLLDQSKPDLKRVLYVHGPIGCGKTITMQILLKGFNVYTVDPVDIFSNDSIVEFTKKIAGSKLKTLANIEKINHQTYKSKPNIVVFDNIDLCEKYIATFVETIHTKQNINVPIVMISNTVKHSSFIDSKTMIEFCRPSMLELNKLVTEINNQEKLELNKEDIKLIITKSLFDIRQIYQILFQWSVSRNRNQETLTNLLATAQLFFQDTDIIDKTKYLFNTEKNFNKMAEYASSEPFVITGSLYQNYLNAVDENYNETICDFMDSLSNSNIMYQKIKDDQLWDLYENFSIMSCVHPPFNIRNSNANNIEIQPFRDISYNYFNSFSEVLDLVNQMSQELHLKISKPLEPMRSSKTLYFERVKIYFLLIEKVSRYFEDNKKGKNTSKKEKMDLCLNITDPIVANCLDILVKNVYTYNYFEVDINSILLSKNMEPNHEKIDIRVLKRLINIFTFGKTPHMKSHTEHAIKYHLALLLKQDILNHQSKNVTSNDKRSKVDDLVVDLFSVWKM